MKPQASQLIASLHEHYCRLTGQNLRLGFGRERWWFDWIQAGFTLKDLTRVLRYLQKEIRHGRRNVGALKLINLLQPDRFEDDLAISKVRLRPLPSAKPPSPPPPIDPAQREAKRQKALAMLQQLKKDLR